MKRVLLTLIAVLLCSTITLPAQQHKYNRAGISVLYITYSDGLDRPTQAFMESYEPDSRYDVNTITTQTLSATWPRTNSKTGSDGKKTYTTTTHTETITQYLNQNHIGRQIISGLFNRKADGSMDLLTVHHRGEYNATDADYLESISTKRGAEALQETGELLIDNSYIVVIDNQNTRYEKVGEDDDYYYRGHTIGYIYKIEWDEEMLYAIWDCWIDENTPEEEKEARRAAFDRLTIPITFISSYTSIQNSINTHVEAAKKNPYAYGRKSESTLKAEALETLLELGTDQSFDHFEGENEDLALKTSLYDTHPLRAKLGTKEGLGTDYTFYVYENVQDASGNIRAKRVGVIRSTNKIADNDRVTTGDFEPSVFYQYAGRRLQKGQDMTEKKKICMAIGVGGAYDAQHFGANWEVEFDGYSTLYTQYFVGMRGNIGGKGYNGGIYAGYGFRTNNFHLFPLVGIHVDGLTGITKLEEEKYPSAYFAQLALKTNINIYYPVQFYALVGYNFKLAESDEYKKYNPEHSVRNPFGLTASAGFRFCF